MTTETGTMHYEGDWVSMEPGPLDVHTHPRAFDAISTEGLHIGKAGLRAYSEAMLRSGFTGMIAMPNEFVRRPSGLMLVDSTELLSFPVATPDRLMAFQALAAQESYVPTGNHFGLDPEVMYLDEEKNLLDRDYLREQFAAVSEDVLGLKIYGAETTVKHNVNVSHIPEIVPIWGEQNPDKPVTLHLEDGDVMRVLRDVHERGDGHIPLHIAHVSSREELEAVIWAKGQGMNVTCEVTPHHLFLDASDDAYMKPTLKELTDQAFLWEHIDAIDMFATDCAPHQESDKAAVPPAFGVTNHSSALPLIWGAVADGRLTPLQAFDKLCIQPRKRFNLPIDDGSKTLLELAETTLVQADLQANPAYHQNPFLRLPQTRFKAVGIVQEVFAGHSFYGGGDHIGLSTSYDHVLSPRSIGAAAMRNHQ